MDGTLSFLQSAVSIQSAFASINIILIIYGFLRKESALASINIILIIYGFLRREILT